MIYRQKNKKSHKFTKFTYKTKTNMRDKLRGIIFGILWFLSIFAGLFLLICPIVPLVVIKPKLYRKWSDVIFGIWEPFPVAMMEIFFDIRVVLSGDQINPYEGSLFVMNHRTRVDWNFLWMGLFHSCQPKAHNMKYVLKAPIMHIPGPGWVMQSCSFIFINRNWEEDKHLLDKMLDYLNESDQVYQVLIFPEGTDLSESNIEKSHKYADKNDLERYFRLLHPRTTGFAFLANKMKTGGQLKAIYDVTVAYPKTIPQNELDLFCGKFPEEVHFHIKRYSSSVIPFQEKELKNWLTNIWREKEVKLQKFYTTGYFSKCHHDEDDDAENYIQASTHIKVDYGKVNVGNGSISYKYGDYSNVQDIKPTNLEIPVDSTTSLQDPKPGASTLPYHIDYGPHLNCDNIYRSKNYHPSHLLYVVLAFWLILIVFWVYEMFNNFYVQIWVLTHSFLFIGLSLAGTGFHQMAASIFFYRYKRKPPIVKKIE